MACCTEFAWARLYHWWAKSKMGRRHHLCNNERRLALFNLAFITDLYSRSVVSWSMSKRITSILVWCSKNGALATRQAQGVIVHSDRGSQYCSHAYRNMIEQYGLTHSMSRKGNCWERQRLCWEPLPFTESWGGSIRTNYGSLSDVSANTWVPRNWLQQKEKA